MARKSLFKEDPTPSGGSFGPPPISIVVYKNGDSKASFTVMCDLKSMRTLEAIFKHISSEIRPKFGAVRKLFALQEESDSGKLVISINELHSGSTYVACGSEPLERMGYTQKAYGHDTDSISSRRRSDVPSGARRSLTAHLEEDELDEFHFTAMDRRLSQTHLQPRAPTPIHHAPSPGHSPRTSQIPILATTGRASAARERRSSSAISRAAAAAATGHGGDSLEVIMRVARNSGVVDRTTGADRALTMLHILVDELSDEVLAAACFELRDAIDHLCISVERHGHARQVALEPEIDMSFDAQIDSILDFITRKSRAVRKLKSKDAADEYIADNFTAVMRAALAGRLAHWEVHPRSFVALVVLLDQFPRSVYRGTSDMFLGQSLVRRVVTRAVTDTGVIDDVTPGLRVIPILALSHQEDLRMQRLCLEEWGRLTETLDPNDPEMGLGIKLQENHDMIDRFGRFPDRNSLLGRHNTHEEDDHLAMRETARARPSHAPGVMLPQLAGSSPEKEKPGLLARLLSRKQSQNRG